MLVRGLLPEWWGPRHRRRSESDLVQDQMAEGLAGTTLQRADRWRRTADISLVVVWGASSHTSLRTGRRILLLAGGRRGEALRLRAVVLLTPVTVLFELGGHFGVAPCKMSSGTPCSAHQLAATAVKGSSALPAEPCTAADRPLAATAGDREDCHAQHRRRGADVLRDLLHHVLLQAPA